MAFKLSIVAQGWTSSINMKKGSLEQEKMWESQSATQSSAMRSCAVLKKSTVSSASPCNMNRKKIATRLWKFQETRLLGRRSWSWKKPDMFFKVFRACRQIVDLSSLLKQDSNLDHQNSSQVHCQLNSCYWDQESFLGYFTLLLKTILSSCQ